MLQITIILLAVFTGTNSESFKWNGYDVTRKTISKDGVKNFTQSLSRTVDGITTVDRTVTLTNITNNKIISVDHSITTTNKGIVTFDRTLEHLNAEGNLIMHDHYFNSSHGDIVTSGSNYTVVQETGKTQIDYLEVIQVEGGDVTIDSLVEDVTIENIHDNVIYARLISKADRSKELSYNVITLKDDGSQDILNGVATITNDGNKYVDFTVTNITNENKDTFIVRSVAFFEGNENKLMTIDSNSTTILLDKNSKHVDRIITIYEENGEGTIEEIIQNFTNDGALVNSKSFKAIIDVNGNASASDATYDSSGVNNMILLHDKYMKNATVELGYINKAITDLQKYYNDLLNAKNIKTP